MLQIVQVQQQRRAGDACLSSWSGRRCRWRSAGDDNVGPTTLFAVTGTRSAPLRLPVRPEARPASARRQGNRQYAKARSKVSPACPVRGTKTPLFRAPGRRVVNLTAAQGGAGLASGTVPDALLADDRQDRGDMLGGERGQERVRRIVGVRLTAEQDRYMPVPELISADPIAGARRRGL